MPEEYENFLPESEDASRRDEARPFTHEEMLTCEECLRANPPTRSNCFYCGAALPRTDKQAAQRQPRLRQPETWREGHNIVLSEKASISDELLRDVSGLLRIEREEAARILAAAKPLPLARVDSLEEARLVEERLRAWGLSVLVVSDKDLLTDDDSQRRARAFELAYDALVIRAAGGAEVLRAKWSDLVLLVTGRLLVRRVEMEERRKKSGSEAVEAREMTGDVLLLDIYTRTQDGGWRVASDSFDFSCLKERKALIASQNFATLVEALRERSPHIVVDDSYNGLRHALASVWPPDERVESRGLRRERPGRFNTEAVLTSDNERQFTRYSRLRHLLLLRDAGIG